MFHISAAKNSESFDLIAQLADQIWREHYIPIIGLPQVNYMLSKFQTASAIENQVQQGMAYFLLYSDKTPVGYCAIQKENRTLFLSKIYLLKLFRGQGFGKQAMCFIEDEAKKLDCEQIKLTVNKDNIASIEAYEKIGFTKASATIKDIGEGFIMDDYVMLKPLF